MAVYELRGIDDTLRDILNTLKSGIATASTGPSSVTIIGDYVGLARDSTLQDILSRLQSALYVTGSVGILGQPISVSPSTTFPISGTVGIAADYIGLARDSTLQSVLSQLRSVLSVTGSVGIIGQPISVAPSATFPVSGSIGIIADYVGLARDSTLQSILTRLQSTLYVTGSVGILGQPISVVPSGVFPISGTVGITADYVGLARDSTAQSILSQLRSVLSVTGSVGILGQPIAVSPSTTFPISGTVGVSADYVGLARDSTLQSILSQLRSPLSVTGSVAILGQPISVSPGGTFPISGAVGVVADYVGLARDSTLQSILSQLRSVLYVTGSVGILGQPISVSPAITFPVSGTVGIIADNVGLARDSTLQSILTQLRTSVVVTGSVGLLGQPLSVTPSTTFPVSGNVGIAADFVGLARDSSLQSILNQLRSYVVVTGTVNIGSSSIMVPVDIQGAAINVPINVVTDSVGLARDSSLQSILSQLRSTLSVTGTIGIIADYVGLARDSTLQSILSQLRSYVVVTGTVNIGSSSIMVPVDIQGAAINVPINIVTDSVGLARDSTAQSILSQLRSTLATTGTIGIIADYVGLARDSSLQSILNQLKTYVAVTGSVSILGQPISVYPSTTFPVSGTVGIAADFVGLARDSSLQSILSQLKSTLSVTGSVGILGQPISVSPSRTFPVSGTIGIIADNVGLARDSTLQSILSQLRSTLATTGTIGIIADYVGLARDSSLQSILSQLRSYVVVTGTVNIGSSSIMVPVDIRGAAINVPINIVTDSVGLARDSTLNNMRYRLYGVNPDATGILDTTDGNTYTVTATSWTRVQCYTFYPRYMPVKSYAFYVIAGIQGYIDTSGQTLYVRIRETRSGTTAQGSTGSTSNAWMWPSMTVFAPLNEGFSICVDAYVTSGTGYITYVWLYIHPIDTAWALTSWNTGGYTAVPLTATSNKNLKIAFAEDLIGVARDSTVASTKLRGGTLNVSSITMNPNTAYTLIGSNSNRISVAVLNSGAGTLYIGPSTTSLIWPVYPGQTIVLNYINALYGQTTATGTVVIMELAY